MCLARNLSLWSIPLQLVNVLRRTSFVLDRRELLYDCFVLQLIEMISYGAKGLTSEINVEDKERRLNREQFNGGGMRGT